MVFFKERERGRLLILIICFPLFRSEFDIYFFRNFRSLSRNLPWPPAGTRTSMPNWWRLLNLKTLFLASFDDLDLIDFPYFLLGLVSFNIFFVFSFLIVNYLMRVLISWLNREPAMVVVNVRNDVGLTCFAGILCQYFFNSGFGYDF